mgnify:CR=1 FL=1
MARSLLERLNEYKTMLNTPIGQSQGGLLSNIPQGALLGSAIYGQGIQGKDPFSALLPAVAQTAQLQTLMTPKKGRLISAYDPNKENEDGSKGAVVYEYEKDIKAKGLTPVPKEIQGTAAERNYASYLKVIEEGDPMKIKIAASVFGKKGKDPMTLEEFLGGVAKNLAKSEYTTPEDISKKLPEFEKLYNEIYNTIETPTSVSTEIPQGFKGNIEQWNILKQKNKKASDQELIDFFNKKYGG